MRFSGRERRGPPGGLRIRKGAAEKSQNYHRIIAGATPPLVFPCVQRWKSQTARTETNQPPPPPLSGFVLAALCSVNLVQYFLVSFWFWAEFSQISALFFFFFFFMAATQFRRFMAAGGRQPLTCGRYPRQNVAQEAAN